MKKFVGEWIRAFILIFTIPFIVLSVVACRIGSSSMAPGNEARDFSLSDLAGKQFKLSSFRGKVVLLNFWSAWCESCKEELPALERASKELKKYDVEVVSVGIDDTQENFVKIVDKAALSFPILLDSKSEVKAAYKLASVPETFIIDREGKFVLFNDPVGGPDLRIKGPRPWDDRMMIQALAAVAQAK